MCAHSRKLESQEGSGCAHNRKWNHRGMCAYNRKWNHRRVWVYAHNRKVESGGSGCVLTTGSWNHRRVWVVLGVQMQMCFCSGQFPQDLDMQLERY